MCEVSLSRSVFREVLGNQCQLRHFSSGSQERAFSSHLAPRSSSGFLGKPGSVLGEGGEGSGLCVFGGGVRVPHRDLEVC